MKTGGMKAEDTGGGSPLDLPEGTWAFAVDGDDLEPKYHAGDILLVAPVDGKYLTTVGGRVTVAGRAVGVLRMV